MRRTPPLTYGNTAVNSRSNATAPMNIHNTRYSPTKIQKPKKTSPSKFLSPKTLMNSARLAAATSHQVPVKQCLYYGRGGSNQQQPQVKILTDPQQQPQVFTTALNQQFSSVSSQQTKYGHQSFPMVVSATNKNLSSYNATTQRSAQISSNIIGTTQNKQLQQPNNLILTQKQETNCSTASSHHRHYHHHFSNDQQALSFQNSLNYRILNPQPVAPSSEIYNNLTSATMGQSHSANNNNSSGCSVTLTQPVSNPHSRQATMVTMKSSSTSSLPIPTSSITPLSGEVYSNNTSVNSSLASITTSSTSISAISTRSSVSSNVSSLSIGSDISDSLKYSHDPRGTTTTSTRFTWNNLPTTSSFTNTNVPSNTNQQGHGLDKKTEPFSERKSTRSIEPSIKEDEISSQQQSSSIHNKQLGLTWSPTKLQRAQERTKRQILSVLLSPSSSDSDEEEEEIFAKIQQRYNEATLRINSIINSTLPGVTNPTTTTTTSTSTNITNVHNNNQTTTISANPSQQKPQPKAAPQLSSSADSNGSSNSRSRPLTFKTQNLTSSLQQEKDRIEGLYLPPIVFPPKNVNNNFEIHEDNKMISLMLQQDKTSCNSSFESGCSSMEYSTPNSSSETCQGNQALSHRYPQTNNRYSGVVSSVLDTLFENCEERTVMFDDDEDDEDLLSIGHSPMFSSPSSLGMEDCSLSSYDGEESPALSPESIRQEALKMERDLFFDRVPPEARLKIDDFSVEVRSFGSTSSRHIPTITLVAHCLNQIFLNGSKATSLFLERMMSIVCDRAEIDHRCLLSALFFMVKLQNPSFIQNENNMSLFSCDPTSSKNQVASISTKNFMFVFHVCLMISSKINEDNYYNNKTFFKYMAPNEFRLMFHSFNMDMAFDYMPDMRRVMVKEDGSVPIFPVLSCSERFHSQTLANEHQKKLFQQFNKTEVNITRMLNYDVCVKEQELYNFLHKLERVNESLLSC
ncbi:hypothetical protein C9374_007841 [Naegleria lovaniensis]|uniref:Uncharacterized protein n=1 Tax=Naegleria lovaniensis TaxID=51637 RepID=A0AA88GHK1_NAELO|nr:uncharacterized protein C9374_007841 [Naegleria lovaniensis]KAG2378693.1 hypothetical protein C9374_007841 [Naegleria lovaniensis]